MFVLQQVTLIQYVRYSTKKKRNYLWRWRKWKNWPDSWRNYDGVDPRAPGTKHHPRPPWSLTNYDENLWYDFSHRTFNSILINSPCFHRSNFLFFLPLQYRNKLNEQQNFRLNQQREALTARQEEMSAIDKRISELQERLHRKRVLNQQLVNQISAASHKAVYHQLVRWVLHAFLCFMIMLFIFMLQ